MQNFVLYIFIIISLFKLLQLKLRNVEYAEVYTKFFCCKVSIWSR
jgi:hypothetical protein